MQQANIQDNDGDIQEEILRQLNASLSEINTQGEKEKLYDISVKRSGQWFELSGWVKNSGVKSHLIAHIPDVDGEQWIIDKLRII